MEPLTITTTQKVDNVEVYERSTPQLPRITYNQIPTKEREEKKLWRLESPDQ